MNSVNYLIFSDNSDGEKHKVTVSDIKALHAEFDKLTEENYRLSKQEAIAQAAAARLMATNYESKRLNRIFRAWMGVTRRCLQTKTRRASVRRTIRLHFFAWYASASTIPMDGEIRDMVAVARNIRLVCETFNFWRIKCVCSARVRQIKRAEADKIDGIRTSHAECIKMKNLLLTELESELNLERAVSESGRAKAVANESSLRDASRTISHLEKRILVMESITRSLRDQNGLDCSTEPERPPDPPVHAEERSKASVMQLLVGGAHLTPKRANELLNMLEKTDEGTDGGVIISHKRIAHFVMAGFYSKETRDVMVATTYCKRPLVQTKELPADLCI